MGGSSLTVPEGGGGPQGGGGPKTPIDDGTEDNIKKNKSLLEQYWSWAQDGYEGFANKVGEVWGQISQAAGAVMNGIGNMWAAEHEKKMQIIDNEQTVEEEAMAKSMERELLKVENSKMTEDEKAKAETAIKEKYDAQQLDIAKGS